MLRPVILEYRLYILHHGNKPYIQHENQDSRQSLNQIQNQHAFGKVSHPAHDYRRQQHENTHRHNQCQHHGKRHENVPGLFLAQLFFNPDVKLVLFVFLRIVSLKHIRRVHQHLGAVNQRRNKIDHASYQRYPSPFAALWCRLSLHVYFSVRKSDGDGRSFRSPHHYALHYGLSAYGGRACAL